MQLTCRACGQPIPAEDVNIKLAIAKCGACDAVFSFAGKLAQPEREAALARRPPAPPPHGYHVEQGGGELLIWRRWFSPWVFFLVLFCIAWDGLLIFWYGIALTQDDVPWIMIVFPVLHVAVGVGLTYFVLCCFVNRTRIQVSMGRLTMRHGPLPCPGNFALNSVDVDQFYCRGVFHQGQENGRYTYEVHALLYDGGPRKLITGLGAPDEAIFIEQQLEDHLRIADRPIEGELPR